MIITFCGHGRINISSEEIEKIKEFLIKKIKKNPSVKFYLGGYGDFDNTVLEILKNLKADFPDIELVFITPYLEPNYSKLKFAKNEFDEIIYPPLENVPKKFAILERNKWMVDNSDFVIAYVKYSWGGARKTLDYAIKKKIPIINFAV